MKRLIDADAAIDRIRGTGYADQIKENIIMILMGLPSAQPKRETAHWVPLDERFASWSSYYKCSECGFRINLRTVTDLSGQSVDYCPHCGLRMEVVE